jgi:hypothetical protein
LWSIAMRLIAVSGRCRSSVGWMVSTRDSSGQTQHSAAWSPQGIDDIQYSPFCRKLDRQCLNIHWSHLEVLSSKAPHKPTRRCNPSVLWIERLNGRRDLRVSIVDGFPQKFCRVSGVSKKSTAKTCEVTNWGQGQLLVINATACVRERVDDLLPLPESDFQASLH